MTEQERDDVLEKLDYITDTIRILRGERDAAHADAAVLRARNAKLEAVAAAVRASGHDGVAGDGCALCDALAALDADGDAP